MGLFLGVVSSVSRFFLFGVSRLFNFFWRKLSEGKKTQKYMVRDLRFF